MALIKSFKTQTTVSSYVAGPFTITSVPQNIDVETVTVNTAVKLYRGLLYEKITTSTDDQATMVQLLAVINELSEGSAGIGGLGGLSKVANLGTGTGLYKEIVNGEIRLKTLKAGANVTLNVSDNEIMITGTTPPVSVPIDSISNVGPGSAAGVYKDVSGQTARLRKISAGNNVTVVQNADDITINAIIPPIPSQGVTSGQNVGSNQGFGVFKDVLSTTTARFKRIIPGNNITISSTEDDITINAVVPTVIQATVTGLANVGSVSSIATFKELTSTIAYFRKIKAGNNATVALDGDDIVVSAVIPPASGAQTITNVGTSGAAGVFKQLTGTEAQLRKLKEGSNVSIDVVGDDIVISAVPGEGAEFASGENIGDGEGAVYKNTLGSNLVFRTIKAGDNISIVQNADELVIHAIEGGETTVGGVVSDATAGAEGLIKATEDNIVHLKGIKGGSNVTVTTSGADIIVAANPGVTSGSNVGTGEGQVFKQINSGTASFKSIKAGENIVITDDGTTITIEAETGGDIGLTTLASDGTSGSVAVNNGVTGSTAHFKGIKAGSNVTVTGNSTDITIAASFDGLTSGTNDGDGAGKVFKAVTGGVGSFRSIKAGTGVSISQDTNNITINAAGGSSGVESVENNGDGAGIGMDVTGPTLNLKSIKAGANITVTEAADEIIIGSTMDLSGAVTSIVNVDGGDSYDARVLKGTTGGTASMRSIKAGDNVTITEGTDIITIAASGGSAGTFVNDGDGVGKVYKSTAGTEVHMRSIKAGANISISQDTNNIVISAVGGGGEGGGVATGFNDYSESDNYLTGDVVIRESKILRANEDITAGAFNIEQWNVLGGGTGTESSPDYAKISNAITPEPGFANFIPTYDYPLAFTESNPYLRTLSSGQFCWIGNVGNNDTGIRDMNLDDSDYFEISIDSEEPASDRFIQISFANKGTDTYSPYNRLMFIDENLNTYLGNSNLQNDSFDTDFRFGRKTDGDIISAYRGRIKVGEVFIADDDAAPPPNGVLQTPDEEISPTMQYIGVDEFDKIGVYIRKPDLSFFNSGFSLDYFTSVEVYGFNSSTNECLLLASWYYAPEHGDIISIVPIIMTNGFDITIRSDGNWEIPYLREYSPGITLVNSRVINQTNYPSEWVSFKNIDGDTEPASEAYGPSEIAFKGDNIQDAQEIFTYSSHIESEFYISNYNCTKESGEPEICENPLNDKIIWVKIEITRPGNYSFYPWSDDWSDHSPPLDYEIFTGGPDYASLTSVGYATDDAEFELEAGTHYIAMCGQDGQQYNGHLYMSYAGEL